MISLSQTQADLFIVDNQPTEKALKRTTHLGIGAHQDDLEFMALHGILECFQREDKWFGGIICTNGAGSARTGPYAEYSDEHMQAVRHQEQRTAATIGQYGFIAQLAHPSATVKSQRQLVVEELQALISAAQPQVVYTHNPADKHTTHVGVFLATLEAIRAMPIECRPEKLLGCEVWRGLDWLDNTHKIALPVTTHPNLSASLNGVFDSQIAGGKRYDLAVEGRRLANATFLDSHSVDAHDRIAYAMDLTPLIKDDSLDPLTYVLSFVELLKQDIEEQFNQTTSE